MLSEEMREVTLAANLKSGSPKMSDPVSQAEIEDVLSSIRRLVSEDGRKAPEVEGKAPPVRRVDSRLVLTPALRVHEGGEARVAEMPLRARDPQQEGTAAAAKRGSEPQQLVSEFEAEAEVRVGLDEIVAHPSAGEHSTVNEGEGAEEEAAVHQVAEELEEAPWRDPSATLYQAAEHAGNVEDLEALIAPKEETSGADTNVSAVVKKIAELEAKVAQRGDHWEPDGMSGEPYSGKGNVETLEWQDHLEDEAPEVDESAVHESQEAPSLEAEALAQDAVLEGARDALNDLAAEESVIDEESLRELVAEIVRSELQGPLGERITRNVRKLVRREIHRALAAQDLI